MPKLKKPAWARVPLRISPRSHDEAVHLETETGWHVQVSAIEGDKICVIVGRGTRREFHYAEYESYHRGDTSLVFVPGSAS